MVRFEQKAAQIALDKPAWSIVTKKEKNGFVTVVNQTA